jgi:hypothetical protein
MIRINGLHEEPPIPVKSCKHIVICSLSIDEGVDSFGFQEKQITTEDFAAAKRVDKECYSRNGPV